MDDADGKSCLIGFDGIKVRQHTRHLDLDIVVANGGGLGKKVGHHGIVKPHCPEYPFSLFTIKGIGKVLIALWAVQVEGKAHADGDTEVEEGTSHSSQIQIVSDKQGALVDVG